jgi:uncharacterized 2Fe-2S/4Fe-4S cluster protein (DUF4445 family)
MKIVFKEEGKEAELVEGRTILSYVQELGIDLNASCGGEGKCGQCMVEVECADSALSGKTGAEKKFIPEDKKRLACQTRIIRTDEHIYVCVPKRTYYVLESGEYKEIALEPFIHVEGERVFCQSEDLGEYTGEIYGIALDIGTTTLSMYLIDLENGKVHSVISRENPQTRYGNNVISRIEFARNGQSTLESEIRTTVNSMITTLKNDAGNVYEMVVVGNPVMRDLFFGYSVESLGKSPYEPQGVTPITKIAEKLGLVINRKARVYGLPLIGSFVGADTLAVVLATDMYKSEKICLAIDIGTNTEIVLGNRDGLIATSCAAGPAFEGAGVRCGIGGVSGAIKEVSKNGDVRYKTIDDAAPVGICGSGLIDTLAELLDKEIIDGRGKFYGAEKEFNIAEGISISERDIDQLNLAKTAVSVGVRVLLERYGLTLEDIDRVFLAGGFVNFTNTEHAIRIGLLPAVEREKVKKVGNAAVEGARQVLISKTKREDAEAVAARIEHVKLENEANFMELFVSELYFQAYL